MLLVAAHHHATSRARRGVVGVVVRAIDRSSHCRAANKKTIANGAMVLAVPPVFFFPAGGRTGSGHGPPLTGRTMSWAWITAPTPSTPTGGSRVRSTFGPRLPGPFRRCSSGAGLSPHPGSLVPRLAAYSSRSTSICTLRVEASRLRRARRICQRRWGSSVPLYPPSDTEQRTDETVSEGVVARTSNFVDRGRAYEVWLDEQIVGELVDGSVASFEVVPGRHRLRIRTRAKRSDALVFNLAEGERTEFECGLRGPSWRRVLQILVARGERFPIPVWRTDGQVVERARPGLGYVLSLLLPSRSELLVNTLFVAAGIVLLLWLVSRG